MFSLLSTILSYSCFEYFCILYYFHYYLLLHLLDSNFYIKILHTHIRYAFKIQLIVDDWTTLVSDAVQYVECSVPLNRDFSSSLKYSTWKTAWGPKRCNSAVLPSQHPFSPLIISDSRCDRKDGNHNTTHLLEGNIRVESKREGKIEIYKMEIRFERTVPLLRYGSCFFSVPLYRLHAQQCKEFPWKGELYITLSQRSVSIELPREFYVINVTTGHIKV